MNEWINEWMNEWMSEWMNDWMNERTALWYQSWLSECMNNFWIKNSKTISHRKETVLWQGEKKAKNVCFWYFFSWNFI